MLKKSFETIIFHCLNSSSEFIRMKWSPLFLLKKTQWRMRFWLFFRRLNKETLRWEMQTMHNKISLKHNHKKSIHLTFVTFGKLQNVLILKNVWLRMKIKKMSALHTATNNKTKNYCILVNSMNTVFVFSFQLKIRTSKLRCQIKTKKDRDILAVILG